MRAKEVRVYRDGDVWKVEFENVEVFPKQALAWTAGKRIARDRQVEAVLYGRNGSVRELYGLGPVRRRRAA